MDRCLVVEIIAVYHLHDVSNRKNKSKGPFGSGTPGEVTILVWGLKTDHPTAQGLRSYMARIGAWPPPDLLAVCPLPAARPDLV